jgi:Raf kinase inhibitor-like YbhB/YbcL family protein
LVCVPKPVCNLLDTSTAEKILACRTSRQSMFRDTGGQKMQKAMMAGAFVIAVGAIGAVGVGGGKMKITSPAFQQGGSIPSKFTCDGLDTSPALRVEQIPGEAKSLALIADDPDAPSGLFTHWIAWNIDTKTAEIPEGSAPSGAVQGQNDFGKSGYGGPCPPSGTHRYFFKIFALDRRLDLPAGAKRSQLDAAMKGHVLGQGELMGRYSRKK